MLEADISRVDQVALDACTGDAVVVSRELIERLQSEVKFQKTKINALNFEIARLKCWRFGSSSESLDHQSVLFDAALLDALALDTAAEDAATSPQAKAAAPKRRAVRQQLPSNLPRIEHHHELSETVCACGQPMKRIGEDVSEQLDCVPAHPRPDDSSAGPPCERKLCSPDAYRRPAP